MKTLLLTTALAALCLSSACASSNRSADTSRAEFPKYDPRVAEAPSIKPVGVAQKSQAMTAAPSEAPPPMKAYAESYDPSGWIGSSTPANGAAIGGGPKAEAITDENPYQTDDQKPQQQEQKQDKELVPSTP
jgi:hypothetical protein